MITVTDAHAFRAKTFRIGLALAVSFPIVVGIADAPAQSPISAANQATSSTRDPSPSVPYRSEGGQPPPTAASKAPGEELDHQPSQQPLTFPAASMDGTAPTIPAAVESSRRILDETTRNDLLNVLSWAANSFLEPPDLIRLARELGNSAYDAETWADFGSALRANGLTVVEGPWLALMQVQLSTSGRDSAVARSLGALAAGVLRDALESRPPDWPSWEMTISWLLHLSGESVRTDMGMGMQAVFSRTPLDPEKAWKQQMFPDPGAAGIPPVNGWAPPTGSTGIPLPVVTLQGIPVAGKGKASPLTSRPGMQTAVALLPYGSPETVSDWLVLASAEKDMLKAAECWVFDGGRLQPPQLNHFLHALRAWLPGRLGIQVLFIGGGPDEPLRLPNVRINETVEPGIALAIPWLPADARREPLELVPGMILPPIPEQNAVLAWECVRTLQAREFQRRPHLRFRRDALLALSGRTDNGLMSFLLTLGWSSHPEDLFPTLAVAWSGGCDTLFPAAAMLQQQGKEGPMALLLQMADLLSMGLDTAPLMVSRADGGILRQEAALRRGMLTPDRPYPVSISWGSETFGWDGTFLENLF